jgi:hypothetical protein
MEMPRQQLHLIGHQHLAAQALDDGGEQEGPHIDHIG